MLIGLGIMVIIPIWNVMVTSVTPFSIWASNRGSLLLPLDQVTFEAYRQIFTSPRIPRSLAISVFITTAGTIMNVILTVLMAYPLAKKNFVLRNPILLMVLFTMMFSGGLVPMYLLVRDLDLFDSYWALILPGAVSAFNLLVVKSFFQNIPQELEDAAYVDGASDLQLLLQVVLPISKPVLATIALFYAIGHWNAFFDAIIYLQDQSMMPLQVVLRQLLTSGINEFVDAHAEVAVPTESIRMAAVIVAMVPVLIIYPFVQRYFTTGVLLGSIKE
jgi:putative aldouronate transport system permease protein